MNFKCLYCGEWLHFNNLKGWYVHQDGHKFIAKCTYCGWYGESDVDICPNCYTFGTLVTDHCATPDISMLKVKKDETVTIK